MADLAAQHELPRGLGSADVAALAECLAALTGDAPRCDAPLIAPALLLGQPPLAGYAAQMTPPATMAVVHESQSFARYAPLPLDRALALEGEIRQTGASRLFDFALCPPGGATLGRMQTRLRFVSRQDMMRLKGSRFAPHLDKGDVIWASSARFEPALVARYLDLAQDPNPIHLSDHAAQAVGLEAAVVPGLFYAGAAEAFVAQAEPGISICGLKLRFMAPVPVGQGLRYGVLVRARDDRGRPRSIRVFILRQDEMIAAIGDLETRPVALT